MRSVLAQVFLDVVESVNLLVNANGTVVRSEVTGALKFRAYLSGMPECKLGLNDKVLLDQNRGGGAKVLLQPSLSSFLPTPDHPDFMRLWPPRLMTRREASASHRRVS